MFVLLIAAWLISPVYPLNPVQQDTLNHVNLHLTAGFNGPSRMITSGPEVTIKSEFMIHHPFVIRTAFDYRYGNMTSNLYPKGKFHGTTISTEILYYRGTNRMTGYFGIGFVYVKNYISLSPNTSNSLYETNKITEIYMLSKPGFRLSLGLRIYQRYSLELAITEVSPTLITKQYISENQFSTHSEKIRLNNVRLTVGYLVPLGW